MFALPPVLPGSISVVVRESRPKESLLRPGTDPLKAEAVPPPPYTEKLTQTLKMSWRRFHHLQINLNMVPKLKNIAPKVKQPAASADSEKSKKKREKNCRSSTSKAERKNGGDTPSRRKRRRKCKEPKSEDEIYEDSECKAKSPPARMADKKRAIKGILKTPGSPRRKKKKLLFSPKLDYGETYSKYDYDRTMVKGLQYMCDGCMTPLLAMTRYSCPIKMCDFDLCEDCHSKKMVNRHRLDEHRNRKRLSFKRFPFEMEND
ncbi:hypothetical protein AAMO2058_000094500 [Amorphochlora amoebiformis]